MGCDIHFFKEVKINGKWHFYGEADIDRNYELFAFLAGVRNYDNVTPIAKDRGLPNDISDVTKLFVNQWKGDGHSYSYLEACEMEELEKYFENRRESICYTKYPLGYLFGGDWSEFAKYPRERQEGLQDVRFIFWFDN